MEGNWNNNISQKKEYASEIRTLVKKHNISVGMLSIATKQNRNLLNQTIKRNKISKEIYLNLKSGIDKIISGKISNKEIFVPLPKKQYNSKNLEKLKSVLKKKKISISDTAEIIGMSKPYISQLFNREGISDKTLNNILNKLSKNK